MENGLHGLVRLQKKDAAAAAEVLGRAFSDYPFITCFFRDDMAKGRKMAHAFAAVPVHVCLRYGEVYASSGKMEGVAAWLPPGLAPFGVRQVLRSVPLPVLFRFATSGVARMRAMGDYIEERHRQAVTVPHWYLQILGVEPAHQGQGFSSRLLRPMLARIDGEGLPCFVQTNTEKNVAIYERFGFRVVHESKVPGIDMMNWDMLREGRANW